MRGTNNAYRFPSEVGSFEASYHQIDSLHFVTFSQNHQVHSFSGFKIQKIKLGLSFEKNKMSFLDDPNLIDKCLEKLQKYEAKQSRLRKKFGIKTPAKTTYQNIQTESPIPISPIHFSAHEISKSSILSPFSDEKDSNASDSILGPSFSSTPIKYHSSPHEGDPEFPAVTGLFSTTITGRSSTRKMSVLKTLSIGSENCNKMDEENKLENCLNQLNTSMESMSISFQIPHTPIHQYNSNDKNSNSLERSRSFRIFTYFYL